MEESMPRRFYNTMNEERLMINAFNNYFDTNINKIRDIKYPVFKKRFEKHYSENEKIFRVNFSKGITGETKHSIPVETLLAKYITKIAFVVYNTTNLDLYDPEIIYESAKIMKDLRRRINIEKKIAITNGKQVKIYQEYFNCSLQDTEQFKNIEFNSTSYSFEISFDYTSMYSKDIDDEKIKDILDEINILSKNIYNQECIYRGIKPQKYIYLKYTKVTDSIRFGGNISTKTVELKHGYPRISVYYQLSNWCY